MKKQVLIVDDQPGVRLLLEETFKMEDCSVYTADNGIEALEIINKINPNVVFIDYKMPMMNGIEVIKKMRENNYNGKIVLMTAYGEAMNSDEIGINAFLTKPFDIKEAHNILHKMLY